MRRGEKQGCVLYGSRGVISHCQLQPIRRGKELDYRLSVSGLFAGPTIRGVKGAVCRMLMEVIFGYPVKQDVLWNGKLLYIILKDIVLRTYWIQRQKPATLKKACP